MCVSSKYKASYLIHREAESEVNFVNTHLS